MHTVRSGKTQTQWFIHCAHAERSIPNIQKTNPNALRTLRTAHRWGRAQMPWQMCKVVHFNGSVDATRPAKTGITYKCSTRPEPRAHSYNIVAFNASRTRARSCLAHSTEWFIGPGGQRTLQWKRTCSIHMHACTVHTVTHPSKYMYVHTCRTVYAVSLYAPLRIVNAYEMNARAYANIYAQNVRLCRGRASAVAVAIDVCRLLWFQRVLLGPLLL